MIPLISPLENKNVCLSACVIGAGPEGLTSINCLLDAEFKVKCFEKDSYIGGRWNENNHNTITRSFISHIHAISNIHASHAVRISQYQTNTQNF